MILDKKNENVFSISPEELSLEIELKRKDIKHKNLSENFVCTQKDFKKQFAHIYAGRLQKIKERLIKACSTKWGNQIPIRKLSELAGEDDGKCIIVGTIFKHQQLKPSILKEISEENQILPQPKHVNYASESDQIILEDEIQRIRLVGSINIQKLVTGVVAGVLGFENNSGKFEVEDICFAGVLSSPEKPLQASDDCYVVMMSGLSVGNPDSMMELELFIDCIKGDLGSISDQEYLAKVCRIIIAGNSVMDSSSSNISISTGINVDMKEKSNCLSAVKQLDDILLNLAKTIEVDLMPGEFDPSNHMLPQQPFYDCVFPKSHQFESIHCVTNPYQCVIEEKRILGTSGQPINDIKNFTDNCDSLDILENTLRWGHLAPTAPDTLACYPFYKDDPFIIDEQPDIYFAGNQPEFKTKIFNLNGRSTRLICIPSFSNSKTCVIVNLKTLECTPLTFTL